MKYTVIYAKTRTGYSAHAPDLPGCIATAKTLAAAKKRMAAAIAFHMEGLKRHGFSIPPPTTVADSLDVGDAA